MRRCAIPLIVLSCVLVAAAGCGNKNSSAGLTLTGKVMVKGVPAQRVQIKLHSPDGGEFSGQTGADGTFTIASIPAGEMKVTVAEIPGSSGAGMGGKSDPKTAAMMKDKMKDGEGGGGQRPTTEASSKIPAKYSNPAKSGLTWTVSAENLSQEFNLND